MPISLISRHVTPLFLILPNTAHFRSLREDAFLLLRVETAFLHIGYDAGGRGYRGETPEPATMGYKEHLAQSSYHPKRGHPIIDVVDDGDATGPPKCGNREVPPKRNGHPRKAKDGTKRSQQPFWNGWFFPLCPKTGRIMYTVSMYRPGNNAIALDGVEKVVAKYPYLNFSIYDRVCKLKDEVAVRKRNVRNVATYATDKFHGSRHRPKCIANPNNAPSFAKSIGSINTRIADHAFSWPL